MKELFAALEPLSVRERQIALDARCGDDSVVRAELERLLSPHDETQTHPGNVAAGRGGLREMAGQRVGPYEVVEVLGQGGMGVVYLANDTRLARNLWKPEKTSEKS